MKQQRLLGWILAVSVGITSGCLQPGTRAVSPSPEAVLIELPALSQEEADQCGLVALGILCKHHGAALDAGHEARLAAQARTNGGLSGAEVQEALESVGMTVSLFPGELDRGPTGIYRHLDEGRPVLAMISTDGESYHYCLVNGYDPDGDRLFLVDPRRGRIAVEEERFAELWSQAGRFALVAGPHGQQKESELAVTSRSELESMRAGDMTLSDRDLQIIGLTALAILLLILIF